MAKTNIWKILSKYKSDNRWMLAIECPECGYVKNVRKINYREQVSCKRCMTIIRNRSNLGKHRGVGNLTRTFFNRFRNIARRRDVEFTVDIEYLWGLAVNQEMKCALSGLPIIFPTTTNLDGNPAMDVNAMSRIRLGSGMLQTASLDRIDSSKPYEKGNVQWTNKYVNIMKNGFSQDEFVFYCHKVALQHANPELSELKGNKKVGSKVQRLEGEDFQPITPPRAPNTPS